MNLKFKHFAILLLCFALVRAAAAQNHSSALPAGLPNPLAFANGTPVITANQWPARRAELLRLFTTQMYGQMPSRPAKMRFRVYDHDTHALHGKATRTQVAILLDGNKNGPRIDLLLYTPNGIKHPPVILGINFWGNETISTDPGIRISPRWVESNKNPWVDLSCVKNNRATPACRGINARQWPIEKLLNRGYAFATFYRGDLDRDRKGQIAHSIRSRYPALEKGGDNFSTIGAWAWGLSRALDYLQTNHSIDSHRVVLFGWSRLGKAALWAAANDQRFAAVISNESGAGGAKLFRHGRGQTVEQLNTEFPYWYCQNFRKYNGQDTSLHFDQHEVLALIAPRPLYVASAIDDKQSDPLGEFLSAKAVGPVYRLLGSSALPVALWPPVNTPALGIVSYHVRTGGHNVTDYDWDQYIRFCDKYVKQSGKNGGNLREH